MSTIMDAPAEPLTVDDMLAVAYSGDAAAALSATSARAKAVKALPAHLMTDADRDLRERLLDVHLPRLLSAFRDAHLAGSAGADADMIDGLEHIDAAIDGLLAAARSRATDGLTIQSSFLEQRYPVDDEALAAISDEPSRSAKAEETRTSNTLDRKTLIELLPAPAPAASPKAADTEERLFGIRTRVIGMILAPIPVLIFGAVPIVIDHQKAAEYRAMRASVDIPMKIDAVARQRVEGGSLQAVTTVSGELTNRYIKPVRSVWLGSRIYACPTSAAPQSQCHFVAEGSGYVYFSTPIRNGLTVPLHEAVEVDIPDVTGVLRSYVKVTSVDLDE